MTFFKTGLRTAFFGALVAMTFTASAKAETVTFEGLGTIGDTLYTPGEIATSRQVGSFVFTTAGLGNKGFTLTDNGAGQTALTAIGNLNIRNVLGTFNFIDAALALKGVESNVKLTLYSGGLVKKIFSATADDGNMVTDLFSDYKASDGDKIDTILINSNEKSTGKFGTIQLTSFSGSAIAGVPGPVAGAGLPALLLAVGGFAAWRRRKAAIAA